MVPGTEGNSIARKSDGFEEEVAMETTWVLMMGDDGMFWKELETVRLFDPFHGSDRQGPRTQLPSSTIGKALAFLFYNTPHPHYTHTYLK